MPHSLRAKLSGLRYKQIISSKDYDRLCKALDNEEVLDKISAEIEELKLSFFDNERTIDAVLSIIDKYRGSEDKE